ncbi:MAG: hypothetical protein CV087_07475 [Candidatus Brocadia sp. WS118]|nr:MAG: hypothetical protein CV087_07475 [Candidatus Brocadia sp. WS118]
MQKYIDDFGIETSEMRVLPIGGSNILCSYQGYLREIKFRKERNKELAPENRFDLPTWKSLEIYKPE